MPEARRVMRCEPVSAVGAFICGMGMLPQA
jgi:hypothetical protein